MQNVPSLVQQPGWISGAAAVVTALCTGSPHAQIDEVRLVGPTHYLDDTTAVVIHVDAPAAPMVDYFTGRNSRTPFIESYARRAARRQ